MGPIAIHTIGYTGNGGTDAGLLKRIANTLDSSSRDLSQPTGMYFRADSTDQLNTAFNAVACEVLHPAR